MRFILEFGWHGLLAVADRYTIDPMVAGQGGSAGADTGRTRGRRNPTSNDVAREAGVSQSTVSLVMNEKADGRVSRATQEAVMQVALHLGYRPNAAARTLRLGRAQIVALVVPDVTNPYFASVLRGAERTAREASYAVVLVDMGGAAGWRHWLPDVLVARGLDGCILYAGEAVDETLVRRLGRNVVLVEAEAPNAASVVLDIGGGATAAMQHLLELGHRRIGHLEADYPKHTFQMRRTVYRQALQTAGIRFRPGYVARGRFDIDSSSAAARELLAQQQRPTALLCDDDLLAAGAYKAARGLGLRIPSDLSVVGFDDIDLARILEPELTTVAIQAEHVGSEAMASFLAVAQGGRPPRIELPLALRVRGSTGPPPRSS